MILLSQFGMLWAFSQQMSHTLLEMREAGGQFHCFAAKREG